MESPEPLPEQGNTGKEANETPFLKQPTMAHNEKHSEIPPKREELTLPSQKDTPSSAPTSETTPPQRNPDISSDSEEWSPSQPDSSNKEPPEVAQSKQEPHIQSMTETIPQPLSGTPKPPREPTLVEPLNSPHLDYPSLAKRRRQEGTVIIRGWLNREGRLTRAEVFQSSGYTSLDESALDQVTDWIYRAPDNNAPEEWVRIPIVFRLK